MEENVDAKVLSQVIQTVQDIQLKAILGATLYDSVLESVSAYATSGTTMDAQTTTLVYEYIQPFLVHAVLADFIVVNNYKLSNKGLLKLRDDVGESLSVADLENAKNFYDQYKSAYKATLVQYLKDNKLVPSNTDTDTTSESIGWFLG